jgi:hypothetical protein
VENLDTLTDRSDPVNDNTGHSCTLSFDAPKRRSGIADRPRPSSTRADRQGKKSKLAMEGLCKLVKSDPITLKGLLFAGSIAVTQPKDGDPYPPDPRIQTYEYLDFSDLEILQRRDSKILIRAEYIEIYNDLCKVSKGANHPVAPQGVALTGQPGIGAYCFWIGDFDILICLKCRKNAIFILRTGSKASGSRTHVFTTSIWRSLLLFRRKCSNYASR